MPSFKPSLSDDKELRASFLESLSRVCFTLGLGHFLCVLVLIAKFGADSTLPKFAKFTGSITLSGILLTLIGYLCRFPKTRRILSYFSILILYVQTTLYLHREGTLTGALVMLYPLLCFLASPILGSRSSYWVALVSFITCVVLHTLSFGLAPHANELLMVGIALAISAFLSDTFWHAIIHRDRKLAQALRELERKNREMENWVVQLSRTGELLASSEKVEGSAVYEELTKSLSEIRDRINSHFTQLFLQDRLNSIGMLASGVAHELNTPLTSMHFLIAGDPTISPETKTKLISEITRMSGIAKNLLTFARPSDKTEIELNELLMSSKELFLHSGRKKITPFYGFSKAPVWVRGVHSEIQQILLNLVHNAIDAMEETPEPRIWIDLKSQGNSAVLSIRDNGCGIPSSELSKILDPFYTTKPPGKGTGLGLFIVHQIAQKHHIRLEIESALQKGTTFRLIFPMEVHANNAKTNPLKEAA